MDIQSGAVNVTCSTLHYRQFSLPPIWFSKQPHAMGSNDTIISSRSLRWILHKPADSSITQWRNLSRVWIMIPATRQLLCSAVPYCHQISTIQPDNICLFFQSHGTNNISNLYSEAANTASTPATNAISGYFASQFI